MEILIWYYNRLPPWVYWVYYWVLLLSLHGQNGGEIPLAFHVPWLNCMSLRYDDLKSITKWMGIPKLVENDTLDVFLHCLVPTLSAFWRQTRWSGGHSSFDLSRSSEVKSDFPPHLKIKLVACTNYVRNVMLLSKSAQSSCLAAALVVLFFHKWININKVVMLYMK